MDSDRPDNNMSLDSFQQSRTVQRTYARHFLSSGFGVREGGGLLGAGALEGERSHDRKASYDSADTLDFQSDLFIETDCRTS